MACSDGGFHFEDRPDGWRAGLFDVLEGLGAVVHAVTTRLGPNLSPEVTPGDRAAGQIARALGLNALAYARQVHGDRVLPVREGDLAGDADALITNEPSLGLMGRSADCPIVLLADPVSGAVGMAHASWRGTAARIAMKLVAAMAGHYRVDLSRMVGCICPSAGPCCYEVGADMAAEARQSGSPGESSALADCAPGRWWPGAERFFPERGGKTYFDLWSANVYQLVRAGLCASNVHVAGVCTICRNDLLPSYRVEGAAAGRFAAVIARR